MLRYIEWAYPKTGHEVVGYIYIYISLHEFWLFLDVFRARPYI